MMNILLSAAVLAALSVAAPSPSIVMNQQAAMMEVDHTPITPTDIDWYIYYGRCYQLSNSAGVQLGVGVPGEEWYRFGGPNVDIPFKICHSRDRCLDPDGSQWVSREGAHWYMLDQKGSTVFSPGPSWVGNSGWWLAPISNASSPILFSEFTGKFSNHESGYPQVCLKQTEHYDNLNGLYLDEAKHLVMSAANQASCVQVTFKPVRCADE